MKLLARLVAIYVFEIFNSNDSGLEIDLWGNCWFSTKLIRWLLILIYLNNSAINSKEKTSIQLAYSREITIKALLTKTEANST